MGNPKAFLTVPRVEAGYRPLHDRVKDFSEVEQTLNIHDRCEQASRCMDCGVPFCQTGASFEGVLLAAMVRASTRSVLVLRRLRLFR